MPKFGAHIIIAETARQREPALFTDTVDEAFRLGAIGPDLTLFFFDPALQNPAMVSGYQIFIDVMGMVSKIQAKLDELDKLLQPGRDLTDWLTGGLSKDASDIIDLSLEAMLLAGKLALANGVSSLNIQNPLFELISDPTLSRLIRNPKFRDPNIIIDSMDNFGFPLRMFGHPLTNDPPWKTPEPAGNYAKWWWMDMLHYRKTGAFAKALLANATDPVTRSYARGYLSHVAGDICGHPFVNGLVGGPFRNHAYRHMVLEALADTWLWDKTGRGDIVISEMHESIALSSQDASKVANMFAKTLRQVYSQPLLPSQLPERYPDADLFITAYGALSEYIRLSTSGHSTRPKPPADSPDEIIEELQELLSRNSPGTPPKWNPDSPLDYIAALFGWLFKGVVFIAMIATLPVATLARVVTTASGVRWMAYLVKLAIFMILSGLRVLLALMGWGYAGRDDFNTFSFLTDLVTYTGGDDNYPRSAQYSVHAPRIPFYWLEPPHLRFRPELNGTKVSPMGRGTRMDWLLDQSNRFNEKFFDACVAAQSPSETVAAEQRAEMSGFGNAPDFFNMLLREDIPIPDLDLDGDRGFGFRPWTDLPPDEKYL